MRWTGARTAANESKGSLEACTRRRLALSRSARSSDGGHRLLFDSQARAMRYVEEGYPNYQKATPLTSRSKGRWQKVSMRASESRRASWTLPQ